MPNAIYLFAGKLNGTPDFGVTNNLGHGLWQHKIKPDFSQKYSVDHFVWYGQYKCIEEEIAREEDIKKPRRS